MNPNDDCPWKILFNKMEKLESKMEETRIAVVEINHIKDDVAENINRLAKVEKVTNTITVLFKAVLLLGSMASAIKFFIVDKLS